MAVINGTNLPELLQGTVFADTINGLNGDDMIWGFDGNDLLRGGFGDDTLSGGSGNDTLDGGAGEDFFYGGSGLDLVTFASATAGFTLNLVDSFLSTGDAQGDMFFSIERFQLGAFSDRMLATSRAETVLGGGGNDTIDGGAGNDSLQGDAGNDVLIGGAGADRLTGGSGVDITSYETSAAAVAINLTSGLRLGDALGDVFSSIEQFRLSGFADSLTGGLAADTAFGGAGNDRLDGATGNDSLQGDAGNDLLIGGIGADRLTGGDGIDTASYETATAAVTLNLISGLHAGDALGDIFSSIERFQLSGFADRMTGAAAAEAIFGGAGNDTLIGGAGADSLTGGDGIDLASYETATAAVTLNLISGLRAGDALGDGFSSIEQFRLTGFADRMTGGSAAETVFGGAGNDTIDGGAGNDSLQGDAGNDVLIGGAGADSLTGGDGVDIASYETAAAAVALNLVTGFRSGDALGDVFSGIEALRLSNHDDRITLSTTLRSVDGGAGADELTGSSGNDTILGGAGNDGMSGGAGADILNGGSDFDLVAYDTVVRLDMTNASLSTGDALGDQLIGIEQVLFLGAGGPNTYVGSDLFMEVIAADGVEVTAIAGTGAEVFTGMTVVDYSRMTTGVTLTSFGGEAVGGGAADGDTLFSTNIFQFDFGRLILTAQDDVLQFSPTSGVLVAELGEGEDSVKADGSELQIDLDMGAGADTVTGSATQVDVILGSGADLVFLQTEQPSSFAANVFGGFDDDDLTVSGYQTTTVDGGDGNDKMTVLPALFGFSTINGPFSVTGGLGDDTISGMAYVGLFSGGDGADTMTIEARNPSAGFLTVDGGAGADVILMTMSGDSTIPVEATEVLGGEGADSITGTSWFGNYRGGAGADTIDFTSNAGQAGLGTPLGSIVDGGEGADDLTATSLFEAGGLLTMTGGEGDDKITGTSHLGNYSGGAGDDIMKITGLSEIAGRVTVDGGVGDDDIFFSSPNPVFSSVEVTGGEGSDTIEGSSFGGSYAGGDADDLMKIHYLVNSFSSVFAGGGAGNDVITLDGTSVGSPNSPSFVSVNGGTGNDAITHLGGFSVMTFIFNTDWGNDTLTGFRFSVDKLKFDGIEGLDGVEDLAVDGGVITGGGADGSDLDFTTLTYVDGLVTSQITILGLAEANFTDDLLIF